MEVDRSAYHAEYYKQNKEAYIASKARRAEWTRQTIAAAKDVPCMDCGVRYPGYVMDFDHRDPAEKKFNISQAVQKGTSKERLLAEIAKCDVVCANCHRIRTHG